MVHQLLGNSLSRRGGANLLCCKTDCLVTPELFKFNAKEEKKVTLQNPDILALKKKNIANNSIFK